MLESTGVSICTCGDENDAFYIPSKHTVLYIPQRTAVDENKEDFVFLFRDDEALDELLFHMEFGWLQLL